MMSIYQKEEQAVFEYFKKICAIPHGSGDMEQISRFCVDFAQKHHLFCLQDDAKNVLIRKDGTGGLEKAAPIILQGHLDMVCQKTEEKIFDFAKDGIVSYIDGDWIHGDGTTLGADNGIAVAMILAILASDSIPHPPIEAVFTTDEEVGMIGASQMDMSQLKARRMINLDAEDDDELTVSCAGGCDVTFSIPFQKEQREGTRFVLKVSQCKGGHSGVEIDKGRVNANLLMGRLLYKLKELTEVRIISIGGGDKGNAIPVACTTEVLVSEDGARMDTFRQYLEEVKKEILDREEMAEMTITCCETGRFAVIEDTTADKLIRILNLSPNGVLEMSQSISGLVETSLNLGVLDMDGDVILLRYALRSNKKTALEYLRERLFLLAKTCGVEATWGGCYFPWEYKDDSPLQKLYCETYAEVAEKEIKVTAIHAGLECAVFAAKIPDLDCIAIGPYHEGDSYGRRKTKHFINQNGF